MSAPWIATRWIYVLSFFSKIGLGIDSSSPIEILAPRYSDFYRDEIELQQNDISPSRLTDVLQSHLGFYVEKSFLDSRQFKLRGLDSKRLAIYLNDVRVRDVGVLDSLDLSSVHRVVVQRTPDHAGALAGSLRIYTQNTADFPLRLRTTFGSFETQKYHLGLVSEKTSLSSSYDYESTTGSYTVKPKRNPDLYDGGGSREIIRVRNNDSTLHRATLGWNDDLWSVLTSASDLEKGEPGMMGVWSSSTRSRRKTFLMSVGRRSMEGFIPGATHEVNAGFSWHQRHYSDPQAEQNPSPVHQIGNTLEYGVKLKTGWMRSPLSPEVTYSLDTRNSEDRSQSVHHMNAKLQSEFWDQLTASMSAGVGKADGFREKHSDHVGVVWDALPKLSLRLQSSASYRYPSLEELYFNEGFIRSSPNLKPETSRSYELGVDFQILRHGHTALRFFQTHIQDYIQYVLVDAFSYRALNQNRILSQGIELQSQWQWLPYWDLEVYHTQQYVQVRGGSDDGRFLPYTPWQHGRIQSRLSLNPDHQLGLGWEYAHKRMISLANTRMLEDHLSMTGFYQWRIPKKRFSIKLEGNNLLDRQENMDLRGMPLPGRSAYVSVQKDF